MCVVGLRHIDERQRPEIVLHQRDVGGQPRHAFVHIFERLEIGELHHREKSLLKRVFDRRGRGENLIEALLDGRGHLERMINRAADSDRLRAQPPARRRFGQ